MQTLRPLIGNLRSLHVHWNTCVTDSFLVWLAKSLPRLEVRGRVLFFVAVDFAFWLNVGLLSLVLLQTLPCTISKGICP